MKIVNVKANNFLSYKEFNFDIPYGVHLITGYNYDDSTANGAGKSAIMDMLVFAIFGVLPRNIKIDEVCNVSADGSLRVEVVLMDGDTAYRILRSRKPNELRFYKNEIELSAKDAKEAQAQIERTLGIDYQIFVNSVYFYQNATSHFVSASDAEKRDILTNLLNLSIFDDAHDVVAERIKTETLRKTTIESEVNSMAYRMESNDRDIGRFQHEAQQFEANKQTRIRNLDSRKLNIQQEIDQQLRPKLQGLEINPTALEECKRNIAIIDDLLAKLEPLKREIRDAEVEQGKLSYRLTDLNSKKSKYLDLMSKGKCVTCYQPIAGGTYQNEIQAIDSEIVAVKDAFGAKATRIVELSQMLANEAQYRRDQAYFVSEASRIESMERDRHHIQNMIASRQSEASRVESEILQVAAETNGYEGLIQAKIEENAAILGKYHNGKAEFAEAIAKINALTFLKSTYRNVKYFVFENIVKELNMRVADYVQSLFDTDVALTFDTATENKKGDIKQKFSAVLLKGGIERNFNSLSGGEKRRIEIATNFALSDIIANRSGKAFEFMMLDECFEGLDTEGRNRVVELLEVLREKRANILIIDHFETMRTLVDTEIRIEKRDGESRLVA